MGKDKLIDIRFNMKKETDGRDPDSDSKTLNHYHFLLWNKKLPNGELFKLEKKQSVPCRLFCRTEDGKVFYSSDLIVNPGFHWRQLKPHYNRLEKSEYEEFLNLYSTVGNFIIFPSMRIDGKRTINGARGLASTIRDRFDLTAECIRLWYLDIDSPLFNDLERYRSFFELFIDFKGYIDFFLLNDLVDSNYRVKFWLPFDGFYITKPVPQDEMQLRLFIKNVVGFIHLRNNRIDKWNIDK